PTYWSRESKRTGRTLRVRTSTTLSTTVRRNGRSIGGADSRLATSPITVVFESYVSLVSITACAPSAQPRARERRGDERERIPVRPGRWLQVPRGGCGCGCYRNPDDAKHNCVRKRPIGREPGGQIAAGDGDDHAIRCGEQGQAVANRLTPWRIHARRMKHNVNKGAADGDRDEPCCHGANAPKSHVFPSYPWLNGTGRDRRHGGCGGL